MRSHPTLFEELRPAGLVATWVFLWGLAGIGTSFTETSPPSSRDGRAILHELAKVSLDPRNTFKVREVNIDRDALHLTLHRGTLAFFTPVQGHLTGAVFIGDGEILVIPPTKIERFQLNKFTGSPVLTERFSSALFRFTDNTFQNITRTADESSPLEPTADLQFRSTWDEAVRSLSRNLNHRLLQNLLLANPPPFFHATLNGLTHGWFEAFYDERAVEPVLLGQMKQQSGVPYADIWCSFRSPRSSAAGTLEQQQRLMLYDITRVALDAQISSAARLTATARLEMNLLVDGERLLPFELSRELKLLAVEDSEHHPLDFFQNTLLEPGEVAQRGNDVIYVLLNQPSQRQQSLSLVFQYSGDVITNLGNGIYFVGARGTWYPNHGLSDLAHYHLTFQYPESLSLVATGNLVRQTAQDGMRFSEWDSGSDLGVAGFNYGDYLTRSQKVDNIAVEIFANRGMDEIVRDYLARLEQMQRARIVALQQMRQRGLPQVPFPDPSPIPAINIQTVITNVINDAASALQFMESWFGPYPYKKLAISQIPGNFGQGWPSLCYVSGMTFLTREQQAAMGMNRDSQILSLQLMRAHEIAHQWWGNKVAARSYHDTWLMEGMSNYAAHVYAASKDPKQKEFLEEMQQLKHRLLKKTNDGETVEAAGPIWLGWRLQSSKTPGGYMDLVYDKGAWVMHMLRMLMRDPAKDSDDRFTATLKDFLQRFNTRPATTEDFKEVIEEHMTRTMDLDGNHRMDWFFDQWVYDHGIPEYRLQYSLGGSLEKGYSVSGRIEQSGVPPAFEMPVPVFAHYGNRVVWLGTVLVAGKQSSFHFRIPGSKSRPSKITLNDDESVLAVVK